MPHVSISMAATSVNVTPGILGMAPTVQVSFLLLAFMCALIAPTCHFRAEPKEEEPAVKENIFK